MTQYSDTTRRLRTRVAVFACIAAVALAVDQITKALALRLLSETESVRLIPGLLGLRLVHNPGASLGLGSNATWLISLVALVASIAMIWAAARTVSMKWTVLLGFAFAGAVGNLVDRIAYADGFLNGKVVDFIDYGWSVGNVADIFLVGAGIGIVVLIMLGEPFDAGDLKNRDKERQSDDPDVSGSSVDSSATGAAA